MAEKKLTYQEALKALKAQYAEERKQERAEKRNEEKAEKRKATVVCCQNALEALKGVDPAFNRELHCVVNRLQMFIDGKKFTRNFNKGE